MINPEGPNAQQVHYWNEVSGPKWVRLDESISAMIRPFGLEAIKHARPQKGEHVLDVGCGCGETSLLLAREVGPEGSVLGVDISQPMLAQAEVARDRAGIQNTRFLQADAQTQAFASDTHDLVFSRFGVMFFENPQAAFANLRSSLRPGGRLCFICWQSREMNPWLALPGAAAAQHFELPPPPPADAPGPFSMSRSEDTIAMLERAGFQNVLCTSIEGRIDVSNGKSIEDTVSFLSEMGPTGSLFSAAPPEQQRAALASIREVLLPRQSETGIELAAAAWIVSATRN